jgi:hypothetical protein
METKPDEAVQDSGADKNSQKATEPRSLNSSGKDAEVVEAGQTNTESSCLSPRVEDSASNKAQKADEDTTQSPP